MRQGLERLEPAQVEDGITGSLGVATYPHDAIALYAAKRAGRNRVEVAAPSHAVAAV